MYWNVKRFVVVALLLTASSLVANAQQGSTYFNVWGCTSSGSAGLDMTISKDIEVLNFLFGTRVLGCIQEGGDRVRLDKANNIVVIGKEQLKYGSDMARAGNLYTVPWALAHEFAHSMQNDRGFPYPANSKRRELHADFMAGWYLSFRMRYVPQDLAAPILLAWEKGSLSHGKNWERVVATAAGITLNRTVAKTNATVAYNAGLIYVAAIKVKEEY